MMPPAGWIPPEYRQIVYADDLRPQDMQVIQQGMSVVEFDDNGDPLPVRPLTDEEIQERGIRRITGVIDTRTGEYHPNQYFED